MWLKNTVMSNNWDAKFPSKNALNRNRPFPSELGLYTFKGFITYEQDGFSGQHLFSKYTSYNITKGFLSAHKNKYFQVKVSFHSYKIVAYPELLNFTRQNDKWHTSKCRTNTKATALSTN